MSTTTVEQVAPDETHGAYQIDEFHPVPIELSDKDRDLITGAAEFTPVFGAWQSYTLQGVAAETNPASLGPLFPADKMRRRAFIQVNSVPSPTTTQAANSVTAPAAGANIVSISAASLPPPGEYTVTWKLGLDGTPGVGDVDNVKLTLGATILAPSTNDGAVGQYPQAPVNIVIPVGNVNPLAIKAIAVGTAGAIYTGTITLTSVVQYNGFILVGQLGQVSNGQGGKIFAGNPRWEIRSHSSLYFAGDGSTPLTIVTYVERDQVPEE